MPENMQSGNPPEQTLDAVDRFNTAFNRHDIDEIMANMTEDCVFESTAPPAGRRYEGHAAVRACWNDFFRASPTALFEAEEIFHTGDRCVVRWIYHWTEASGEARSVRGVDIIRVRDGKVHEKLAYVKG